MNARIYDYLMQVIRASPDQSRRARVRIYAKAEGAVRKQRANVTAEDYAIQMTALADAVRRAEAQFKESRLRRLFDWTLGFAGHQIRTVEGKLKLLDRVCDVVAVGRLFSIFTFNFNASSYFTSGVPSIATLQLFVRDNGRATLLLFAIGSVYYLSRRCAKSELALVRQTFSPSRTPHEWASGVGDRKVFATVLTYLAVYLGMTWFLEYVYVVALGFVAVFSINLFNLRMQRKNLRKYYDDDALLPAPDDEHREFIMRRRKEAETYLFGQWHQAKEIVAIIASAISFAIAWTGDISYSDELIWLGTALLVATLAMNEAVVAWWRWRRSRQWKPINDDEALADEIRVAEHTRY